MHDVLRPALDAGEVVITDRFVDSSLAYQGAGRTIPLDDVRMLSRWATEGLQPDLTVLLDLPPEVGLARARGRAVADRLESESLDFHQRVRRTFRALAEAQPDRYLVLDARQTPRGARRGDPGARHRAAVRAAAAADPAARRGPATHAAAGRRAGGIGAAPPARPDRLDPPAAPVTAPDDVWAQVIGQPAVVAELQAAVADPAAMTHAWLFTGPPGSGRSVAARAFAAALQCPDGGDGTCHECRTVLAGTHADVQSVVPEGLSIGVDEVRQIVRIAGRAPSRGRWQVVLVEDADRMTEQASNTLLKMLEEPPPRTVFLLCAPSLHPDDVPVTIRSRCRVVGLRTPPAEAVAEVLVRRDGVDPALAAWSAAAAGGHVGRARRLARDEEARLARKAVLDVPLSLVSLAACLDAAADLVGAAKEESDQAAGVMDAAETEATKASLGYGARGPGMAAASRGAGQLKELEKRQKSRATRLGRDSLDRALVDLAGLYRDALVLDAGRRRTRRRCCTPTAAPTPRSWPGGSAPRARCAASTRCWPAGRRWSRT